MSQVTTLPPRKASTGSNQIGDYRKYYIKIIITVVDCDTKKKSRFSTFNSTAVVKLLLTPPGTVAVWFYGHVQTCLTRFK